MITQPRDPQPWFLGPPKICVSPQDLYPGLSSLPLLLTAPSVSPLKPSVTLTMLSRSFSQRCHTGVGAGDSSSKAGGLMMQPLTYLTPGSPTLSMPRPKPETVSLLNENFLHLRGAGDEVSTSSFPLLANPTTAETSGFSLPCHPRLMDPWPLGRSISSHQGQLPCSGDLEDISIVP